MTIDTTVGSLTADAYCDVTFADNFIDSEAVDSDRDAWWGINSTESKERLIKRATAQLDMSYTWRGKRANLGDGETTGQALGWPRQNVLGSDNYTYLNNDVIPKDIKKATVLLAIAFSIKDRAADSELGPLKSLKAGDTELEWRDNLPESQGTIPSKVHDYCRWWGSLKQSLNSESKPGLQTMQMVKT